MKFSYKCAICGWGIFTEVSHQIKYCPKRNCRALIFTNARQNELMDMDTLGG